MWQGFRQTLHFLWIGRYLEETIAKSSDVQVQCAEAATALHSYQQVLASSQLSADCKDSMTEDQTMNTHACLYAINIAEAAGDALNPIKLLRIYVAAAIHLRNGGSWVHNQLATHYMRKARVAYNSCTNPPSSYLWLFSTSGDSFFEGGKWISMSLADNKGSKLAAGSLEHLSLAYRTSLLQSALVKFNTNGTLQQVTDLLSELRQHAINSQVC